MPIAFLERHSDTLRRLAAPVAWTIYFALPVRGWAWIDGLPIGPFEAACIALTWWAWGSNRRQLPAARTLAALALLKVALGAAMVERGFTARYYANDSWTAPVEGSIEFRRTDITRRDERLAFGSPGRPDLPLYYLNDLRFNYDQPNEPERNRLAYSAIWDGFVQGDSRSQRTFYLAAGEGVAGSLVIDGRPAVALEGSTERTGDATLAPGWHSISVHIAAPYGSRREAEAGEVVGGLRQPFDGRSVFSTLVGTMHLRIDAIARWLALSIDVFVLSWLSVIAVMRLATAWRDRRVLSLLWLVAIVEGIVFARPYWDRIVLLTAGNDWLTYEYFAREIALGDPLLARRRFGGGQGGPFYYQPLYPYFLALVHYIFGESIWGITLIQRLLLAATATWIGLISTRLFGTRVGWVALLGGAVFIYAEGGRWADILLAELLFTALLAGWIWLLVRLATEPLSWPRLVFAGVAGGVATLTRSTLLLGWPLVIPVWAASLGRHRVRTGTLIVTIMIGVVGIATLRNWVVAHEFVPIAGSFGANLLIGNEPRRPLDPIPPSRAAMYERVGLAGSTRTVAEYAFQRPGEFAGNLGRKAVYSVGLFELSGVGRGESGASLWYLGMWSACLAGVIRLTRSPTRHWTPAAALPGLAALGHFAAVVLIFPYIYGDRLILPLYPLLAPYAALAVEPFVNWSEVEVPRIIAFLFATPPVTSTTMAQIAMRVPELRMPRIAPVVAALAASVLLVVGAAYWFTVEPAPEIRVRWQPGIDAARRAELERRFLLVNPAPFEDRLTYDLLDTSRANVEALVNERDIQDTDRVDREHFAIPPDVPYGASWMWVAHRLPVLRVRGVVEGILIACALVLAVSLGGMIESRRIQRKLSQTT